MSNPQRLLKLGQSLWYDNIQRRLIENGDLEAMISREDIRGVTSNPSIFNKAITNSNDYDTQLVALAGEGASAEEIYEALAIKDIRAAADLFREVYEQSGGGDGYVSLEVNPHIADNTDATCREAQRLWKLVDRPNLMVKIPATEQGLPAITESIAAGLNINVTLIFSQKRYIEVMEAYLAGLERRAAAGDSLRNIASVASFFVSRIDTKVDRWLEELVRQEGPNASLAASLRGRLAVANAKLAYQAFKNIFTSDRFARLQAHGARLQRPLWASTSTKNPKYSDVKYVDELIGEHTVNTVPPKTLEAFKDHGSPSLTLESSRAEASQAFEELRAVGISFDQATRELEEEGVNAFAEAFSAMVDAIEQRRKQSV